MINSNLDLTQLPCFRAIAGFLLKISSPHL